jgi:hypothetical protein
MVHFRSRKCQALSEEFSMRKIIFSNSLEWWSYQPQTIREVAKVGDVIIERSYSSDCRDVLLALILEEE